MRIVRNERLIRVRGQVGRYAVLAGFLVMILSLLIPILRPEWFLFTGLVLGVGFALSFMGSFLADRYAGILAHHSALAKALKGLDHRYTLLQYMLPVSHVLVEPGGCTVFVVKTQGGRVIYRRPGRWTHRQSAKLLRQFAGQEAVGAPDLEAEHDAYRLQRWLSKRLPGVPVPVRGVVVFVHPDVQLEADNAPVPTFYGKKVKAWLRGPGALKPLPPDIQGQLASVLGLTPQQEEPEEE